MPFPCRSHAALCRYLEKSLSERDGRGKAWEQHGRGMACVDQTRPHCVNQMGKTQSKPLAERHGKGTAWYVGISLKGQSGTQVCKVDALDYRCNFPTGILQHSVESAAVILG
jgi:hypothetical protein